MSTEKSKFSIRTFLQSLIWIFSFILLVVSSFFFMQRFARQRNAGEQYAVWSDYLNQTHRSQDLTVIENRTTTKLPSSGSLLIQGKQIPAAQTTAFYSFVFMNMLNAPLERRFYLTGKYSLASPSETAAPDFQEKFRNSRGYMVLSSVGFNTDYTEAYFYIDHICERCGSSRYVLMKKINDNWKTVAEQPVDLSAMPRQMREELEP